MASRGVGGLQSQRRQRSRRVFPIDFVRLAALHAVLVLLAAFGLPRAGAEVVATWSRLDAGNPPPAMCDHFAVQMDDRALFVHAGEDGSEDYWVTEQQPWVLDLAASPLEWAQVELGPNSALPLQRTAAAAVADRARRRIIMYGGSGYSETEDSEYQVWRALLACLSKVSLASRGVVCVQDDIAVLQLDPGE